MEIYFLKFNIRKFLIFIVIILIIIFFLYIENCPPNASCPIIQYNLTYYGLDFLLPYVFITDHFLIPLNQYCLKIGLYIEKQVQLLNILFIILIGLNIVYLYFLSCCIDYIIVKINKKHH
jgi:hypothetical protein